MTEPRVRFVRHPVDCGSLCITGRFGDRYYVAGRSYQHRGVDYGVPVGTPVYAPAAGEVVPHTNDGSFGVSVCLRHDDGWHTLYAHLSSAAVHIGQRVRARELLGYSGNTGLSTGPHLHWQLCSTPTFPVDIRYSRDPLQYLDEGGDAMADAREVIEVLRADKSLRDQLVAAVLEDAPMHLALDSRKREAWRKELGGGTGGGGAIDVRAAIDEALRDVARRAELGTDDLARGLWGIWRRLQAVSRALDPRQPVP